MTINKSRGFRNIQISSRGISDIIRVQSLQLQGTAADAAGNQIGRAHV